MQGQQQQGQGRGHATQVGGHAQQRGCIRGRLGVVQHKIGPGTFIVNGYLGRFAGRELSNLALPDLVALLSEAFRHSMEGYRDADLFSVTLVWMLLSLTLFTIRTLQNHAEQWIGAALDWSRRHRGLGNFGAALAEAALNGRAWSEAALADFRARIAHSRSPTPSSCCARSSCARSARTGRS